MLPHPVPESLAEIISVRFRALAEPTRIRLLDTLRDGPLTVQELAARVDTTPQNVSKHMAVLADAGIVTRERQGTSMLHTIADPTVFDMCEQVCGSVHDHYAALAQLTADSHPQEA